MGHSREYYHGLGLSICYGSFVIFFLFLNVINRNASWFITSTILGIQAEGIGRKRSNDCLTCESPDNSGKQGKPKGRIEEKDSGKEDEEKDNSLLDRYLYIDMGIETDYSVPLIPYGIRFISNFLVAIILAMFVSIIWT